MGINTSEIKFPFSIRLLGKLCSSEGSKNGICILRKILFFYFPLYIALVLLRIQNGNEHLPLPPGDHWHQDRKLLLGSHDLLQWANVHHLYIHIKAIFLYLGLLALSLSFYAEREMFPIYCSLLSLLPSGKS